MNLGLIKLFWDCVVVVVLWCYGGIMVVIMWFLVFILEPGEKEQEDGVERTRLVETTQRDDAIERWKRKYL